MALTDKLTAIAEAIRAKTGSAEKLTLAQMPPAIAAIQSGSAYPEKFYETDFVMDASVTANGAICTISTGLSNRMVADDNELVMCVITCEPTATVPSAWVKKMIQFIAQIMDKFKHLRSAFMCKIMRLVTHAGLSVLP